MTTANMFVVTGNTFNTGGNWGGGEAVIRLRAGPVFSGSPTDYWAPTNWFSLDNTDTDLGGCGAVLIDVPGATPSQLALALGKDGKAYLLRRNNLGGITAPVASANVANSVRGQSAATYRTSQGTYLSFVTGAARFRLIGLLRQIPPTIVPAWNVSQAGQGSLWVTTTNGTSRGRTQRANGQHAQVEYRHRRSRSHLLRRRQQSLCFCRAARDSHANSNPHASSNPNAPPNSYAEANTKPGTGCECGA